MKTSVTMIRKMGAFDILQRTKDGYFDANVLLSQWNNNKGASRRRMNEFLESPKTIEFIDVIKEESHGRETDNADFKVVTTIKPATNTIPIFPLIFPATSTAAILLGVAFNCIK